MLLAHIQQPHAARYQRQRLGDMHRLQWASFGIEAEVEMLHAGDDQIAAEQEHNEHGIQCVRRDQPALLLRVFRHFCCKVVERGGQHKNRHPARFGQHLCGTDVARLKQKGPQPLPYADKNGQAEKIPGLRAFAIAS
ncbi:hypothetical protein CCACVL1_02261 [Corchorus capsularis]|uniref:Uncharacterized protein n=1 Tax=Corchorus capsularis TaxID=210143 RepID=A0A1R3K9U7_COCAP|nr:hypothetical protein CCACVL1_02261 [Corchorus capsularis]